MNRTVPGRHNVHDYVHYYSLIEIHTIGHDVDAKCVIVYQKPKLISIPGIFNVLYYFLFFKINMIQYHAFSLVVLNLLQEVYNIFDFYHFWTMRYYGCMESFQVQANEKVR